MTWWPVGEVPPGIPDGSTIGVYANHGNGSVVYVTSGADQLFRSTDGGWSYTLINSSTIYDPKIIVSPTSAFQLYMTGFDPAVLYSTDGGETFVPRATGLPPASPPNRIVALFMRRTDPLYLEVIYQNGQVWETFDGGLLWTQRFSLPISSTGFIYADWDDASGHVFVRKYGTVIVSSHPLYTNDGLDTRLTTAIQWDAVKSTLLVGTEYSGLWHQTIASAVDAPSVTDVPSSTLTLNLSPNPTADLTTVTFRVPEGGAHVTAVVVDAAGRSVLRMVDAPLPAGERQLIWDGRVESGERAAAGVYFVRVRAGEEEAKGKVVLIR
jgi:hypothetical protein